METKYFMALKGKGETLGDVISVFITRNELRERAAIKRYTEAGLKVEQIDQGTFLALRLLAVLSGAIEARGDSIEDLEKNIQKAKETGMI